MELLLCHIKEKEHQEEKLLETGKVSSRGKEMNVTAEVKQFEFSGHADRNELFEMIKKIKGNPKVLTVHGDSEFM